MKTVKATDIKTRFGQYLEIALTEPLLIEKINRPVAVLLSFAEYQRMTAVEDRYWADKAKIAESTGYIGHEESLKALKHKE
ncbi:MAG: type II toxin-antitoxin system Phd/YefM family antitoxin [Nitrospirae bacterium]|nr:type II toxin-antitoxin system Phd/YefM family antitoxin [Nitrospirota bacterium]